VRRASGPNREMDLKAGTIMYIRTFVMPIPPLTFGGRSARVG
jgi:hypothetical protein